MDAVDLVPEAGGAAVRADTGIIPLSSSFFFFHLEFDGVAGDRLPNQVEESISGQVCHLHLSLEVLKFEAEKKKPE